MLEYAHEIYKRYKKNNLSETLEYYEHHRELLERRENAIQTIGVSYHRMYDGGVERVLSNLLSIWTKMKYTVILFTEEGANSRDYYYPKEVQRIIIPVTNDLEKRLYKLEKEICAQNVDVFIENIWESEVVLWEMLLVKSHHIPFMIYTHGHFTAIYADANDYAMVSNRVFAMADLVIALSDTNKQFYQLCRCHVEQIENPIVKNLRDIQPAHSERENHRILWIGRITEGKRINDAIKIFAEVKKKISDAELDVVGSGEAQNEEKAKSLCIELGIGDSVHFHGYQAEVENFYQNSAVMLMTSEKEGYPTVLLECKAYGRACVMYSLPYLSLVKDAKGISTSEIGDIDGMAAQLCETLLEYQLRYGLENEARESFVELCKYNHGAKWQEIFRELSQEESEFLEETQDTLMIGMLLDVLRAGIDCRVSGSFEYQVGKEVLRIPRKILQLVRNRSDE